MFPTPGFMYRVSGLHPEEFIEWFSEMLDQATSNECKRMVTRYEASDWQEAMRSRQAILNGKDPKDDLELDFVLRLRAENQEFRDKLNNPSWICSPSVVYGGARCVERLLPIMMEMSIVFCLPLPGNSKKSWVFMPQDRRLSFTWLGRSLVPACRGNEVNTSPGVKRCKKLPNQKDLPTLALSSYRLLKSELDITDGRTEMQVLLDYAFYQPDYFKLFLDRLCLPKGDPLSIGFLDMRKKNNLTKIVGYSLGIDPASWDRPPQDLERRILVLSGLWRNLENDLGKFDSLSTEIMIINKRKEIEAAIEVIRQEGLSLGMEAPVGRSKAAGIMSARRLLPCDRYLLNLNPIISNPNQKTAVSHVQDTCEDVLKQIDEVLHDLDKKTHQKVEKQELEDEDDFAMEVNATYDSQLGLYSCDSENNSLLFLFFVLGV